MYESTCNMKLVIPTLSFTQLRKTEEVKENYNFKAELYLVKLSVQNTDSL